MQPKQLSSVSEPVSYTHLYPSAPGKNYLHPMNEPDFAGGSSVRPSASPTGAQAQKCYQAFTARLKSCPDTKPGLCSLRRVLRSALAAGRGNCRSLGFARDDKGGRSFRPHGCGGENCRSLGYERPFSDSLILDVWPLYQPEPRTIARLTE